MSALGQSRARVHSIAISHQYWDHCWPILWCFCSSSPDAKRGCWIRPTGPIPE